MDSNRTYKQQGVEEEMAISFIRATDLTVGLERISAGFYTTVQHSGREWRTEKKHVPVNNDAVVWHGSIPIPSSLSAAVRLEVYAPFEFEPMLGRGEVLREFTVTVKQLLDRHTKGLAFTFPQIVGDAESPCSSLRVTVKRQRHESGDSLVLAPKALTDGPYGLQAMELLGRLEDATNRGHDVLSRYRKNMDIQDLECSIQLFERVLDDCPSEHPCRAAAQSNLAMASLLRCQTDTSHDSFDVPIALYRDALAARLPGHPDRPSTLIRLADAHMMRFERHGDPADATRAEALLREAVDLSSPESIEKRSAASALQLCARRTANLHGPSSVTPDGASGSSEVPWGAVIESFRRFEQLHDITDLQFAISLLETSVSNSIRNRSYPAVLGNLGVGLLYRFRHLGQPDDLDQAISKQEDAIDLTPEGHPDKPGRLSNLGNTFLVRFQRFGNLLDLELALLKHKEANDLIADDHPIKPRHLNNLANTLMAHLEHFGEMHFLEEAIRLYQKASGLTPEGRSNKLTYLNNLAVSVFTRFLHLGEMDDLKQAISVHRQAVQLTSDTDEESLCLSNLANSLVAHFEYLGKGNDLDEVILSHQRVVVLTPIGHLDRPRRLNDLAKCFRTRFEYLGELGDLEQAFSKHREAMELGGPQRSNHVYLNSLASCLLARFMYLGDSNDLEEAVLGYRKAVDLAPDNPGYSNDFAASLFVRFEQYGESNDLEQAVMGHKKAIALARPGRTNHVYLKNLSTSLLVRFIHLGHPNDLEEAVSGYQKAIKHILEGHWRKPGYLDDLAASLFIRFNCFGKSDDLDEGIENLRKAVALVGDGHADERDYLNNLAICLSSRFTQFGRPDDLGEAIDKHLEAVKCTTGRQTNKQNGRKNFVTRFAQHDHVPQSDIERAIALHREVVRLTPDLHRERSRRLRDLANSLVVRYEQVGELKDLEEADLIYKKAVELEDVSSAPTSSAQLGLNCVAAAPTDEPVSEG